MREPRISATLRKDREIREARIGFGIAAWLFGIWATLRFPTLFVFFLDDIEPIEKILHFALTEKVLKQ